MRTVFSLALLAPAFNGVRAAETRYPIEGVIKHDPSAETTTTTSSSSSGSAPTAASSGDSGHAAAATGAGTCSPEAQIFHMAMATNEPSLIVDGPPEVTSFSSSVVGDLRSCSRWSGKASCCKYAFFEQVGERFNEEANRMAAVMEAYDYMVPDILDPAITALSTLKDESFADMLEDVKNDLQKNHAARLVNDFVNGCEDQIRLHFAQTTCQLCDPALSEKLTEGKYLSVDQAACDAIAKKCGLAPAFLLRAARLYQNVSAKFEPILESNLEQLSRPTDMAAVLRAYHWIQGAGRQLAAAVNRVEFYHRPDLLCERLGQAGYVYEPMDWGWVDTLHPSQSPPSELPKKKQQKLHKHKKAAGHPFYVLDPDPELAQPSPDDASGGPDSDGNEAIPMYTDTGHTPQCVHGRLVIPPELPHGRCICDACWTGETCDRPSKSGARGFQIHAPLVAEQWAQPLTVLGCGMPLDLTSQFARVMLIKKPSSHEPGVDPCSKGPKPSQYFSDLPKQVPMHAMEGRVEFMVTVPQGSEDGYDVCYCFGPVCHKDKSSWWNTGFVSVMSTRTLANSVAELKTEAIKKAEDAGANIMAKTTSPRPCDTQWKYIDMPSITFSEDDDEVQFYCKPGFANMQGSPLMRCVDGEWFEMLSLDDPQVRIQLTEDAQHAIEGKPMKTWDGLLPECWWSLRFCDPNMEGLAGGFIESAAGITRFACPDGPLLVDGIPQPHSYFMKYCQEDMSWAPKSKISCLPLQEITHHHANITSLVEKTKAEGSARNHSGSGQHAAGGPAQSHHQTSRHASSRATSREGQLGASAVQTQVVATREHHNHIAEEQSVLEESKSHFAKHSKQSGGKFGRLSKAVSGSGKRAHAKGEHQQVQKRHGGQRRKHGKKNKLVGGSFLQTEEVDTDEADYPEEEEEEEKEVGVPEDASGAALAFVQLGSEEQSVSGSARLLSERASTHRAQQHSHRATQRQLLEQQHQKQLKKMKQEQRREQRLQREQWLEQSLQRQQLWGMLAKGQFVRVEETTDDRARIEMRRWPVRFTRDFPRTFLVDECWTSWECNESVVPPDSAAAQISTAADPSAVRQDAGRWMFFGVATTICAMVLGAMLRYKQWTGKCGSCIKPEILGEY